jgi:predicted anti-sigma-YlaC factor YlaD
VSTPDELPCIEFVELVTDYLEGALPPEVVRRLEHHLGECDPCQAYLEQMRLTIDMTGRLAEEPVPPEELSRLLESFREWRRGA